MPKKWYSRQTRNRLDRILDRHEKLARAKPLIASVKTSTGQTGDFYNNPDKPLQHRAKIASYRQSSQVIRPINTGTVSRKSKEVLKLVSRKANKSN